MKTPNLHPATGPVATAIALCMETYFPKRRPAFKTYQVNVMVDGHLVESFEVNARTGTEAFNRAVDLRRAIAIRAGQPDLSIIPWSITGSRLAA
ncbi:MAG: hypothetical protein ACRCXD_03000 [Luteolibacter sp.]